MRVSKLLIVIMVFITFLGCKSCKEPVESDCNNSCNGGMECIDNKCQCVDGFEFNGSCYKGEKGYYFGDLSCVCMDTVGFKFIANTISILGESWSHNNVGGEGLVQDKENDKSHFFWDVKPCSPYPDTLNFLFLEFWVKTESDTMFVDVYSLITKDSCSTVLIKP